MREWGILLGAIAIIAVLYDGWRRTRQARGSDLPFKFPSDEKNAAEGAVDPLMPSAPLVQPDFFHETLNDVDDTSGVSDLDLTDGAVSAPRPKARSGSVPGFGDEPLEDYSPSPITPPKPSISVVSEPEPEPAPAGETIGTDFISAPRPKAPTPATQPAADVAPIASDVLTIFVRPAKGLFKGVELRNALVSMGLNFGERDLYHRHSGSGRDVLYSVANASAEGTFPEGAMEGFTSPGVILLIELTGHPDPEHGFEEMVSSARQMGRRLGAEVLDSNQQPLQVNFLSQAKAQVKAIAKKQRNGAGTLG